MHLSTEVTALCIGRSLLITLSAVVDYPMMKEMFPPKIDKRVYTFLRASYLWESPSSVSYWCRGGARGGQARQSCSALESMGYIGKCKQRGLAEEGDVALPFVACLIRTFAVTAEVIWVHLVLS